MFQFSKGGGEKEGGRDIVYEKEELQRRGFPESDFKEGGFERAVCEAMGELVYEAVHEASSVQLVEAQYGALYTAL